MNDYSKILVKVIFTLKENHLHYSFSFVLSHLISFGFVSQNGVSLSFTEDKTPILTTTPQALTRTEPSIRSDEI